MHQFYMDSVRDETIFILCIKKLLKVPILLPINDYNEAVECSVLQPGSPSQYYC